MASYQQVKAAALDVIDDFTKKDLVSDYKPAGKALYSAKTKLSTLAINETVLATMPIRFNKALGARCGATWQDVGALDLVQVTTVGGLIQLACDFSRTQIPAGEPT